METNYITEIDRRSEERYVISIYEHSIAITRILNTIVKVGEDGSIKHTHITRYEEDDIGDEFYSVPLGGDYSLKEALMIAYGKKDYMLQEYGDCEILLEGELIYNHRNNPLQAETIESINTIKTLVEAVGYSIEYGEVTEGLVSIHGDAKEDLQLLEQVCLGTITEKEAITTVDTTIVSDIRLLIKAIGDAMDKNPDLRKDPLLMTGYQRGSIAIGRLEELSADDPVGTIPG